MVKDLRKKLLNFIALNYLLVRTHNKGGVSLFGYKTNIGNKIELHLLLMRFLNY